MFVVVMRGKCDTTAHQGEPTESGQPGVVHSIRRKRLCSGDFRCQFVFAKGGHGVAMQSAVGLCANQRAFSLAKVVVDDQVGAIIKGDVEVITLPLGDQLFRPDPACSICELVVSPMYGLNVLRCAAGIQRVGGEGVSGGVFQGQGNTGHVEFPIVKCSSKIRASFVPMANCNVTVAYLTIK